MLKKQNRLTKRKEFGFVYKKGKRVFSNNLTLIFIPTKLDSSRFGFVLSKKVGKAHIRNKLKRQQSEIIRNNLNRVNQQYNYIFVSKPSIINLTFEELYQEILYLLNKANLFKG